MLKYKVSKERFHRSDQDIRASLKSCGCYITTVQNDNRQSSRDEYRELHDLEKVREEDGRRKSEVLEFEFKQSEVFKETVWYARADSTWPQGAHIH